MHWIDTSIILLFLTGLIGFGWWQSRLNQTTKDYFLGGEMSLDDSAAQQAITGLATELGLGVPDTADGILTLVTANMANAIRSRTVQKGIDPREFALVSYGGCGPLFVANICKELQIKSILIPEF